MPASAAHLASACGRRTTTASEKKASRSTDWLRASAVADRLMAPMAMFA